MRRVAMVGFALAAGLTVLVAPSGAAALNYMKTYCGNASYVGNPSNKYPHLHCGRDFFTLSRGAKHDNLEGRGNCNKANELLADPPWNATNSTAPAAIAAAINAFVTDGCP